jgi:hypothetical protein
MKIISEKLDNDYYIDISITIREWEKLKQHILIEGNTKIFGKYCNVAISLNIQGEQENAIDEREEQEDDWWER